MGTGGTVQWWHCSVAAHAHCSVAAQAQWRHWLSGVTGTGGGTGSTGSVAALAQWQHCLSDGTGSGLPDHDVEAEIVGCGAPLHPVLIEDDNPRDETWGDEK